MALATLAPAQKPFFVGPRPKLVDINDFHALNGHLGQRPLRATAKQQGLQLVGDLEACEACLGAKMPRASVTPKTTTRSTQPLGTVHMDVAGPSESSVGGSQY
ncbi:unnamed protein product, partial [Hapterophycus canaliculatus]